MTFSGGVPERRVEEVDPAVFGKAWAEADRRASRHRRRCAHCNYIGHSHLCGCMGALGAALHDGDLARARVTFDGIVGRANQEIQPSAGAQPEPQGGGRNPDYVEALIEQKKGEGDV